MQPPIRCCPSNDHSFARRNHLFNSFPWPRQTFYSFLPLVATSVPRTASASSGLFTSLTLPGESRGNHTEISASLLSRTCLTKGPASPILNVSHDSANHLRATIKVDLQLLLEPGRKFLSLLVFCFGEAHLLKPALEARFFPCFPLCHHLNGLPTCNIHRLEILLFVANPLGPQDS